MLVSPLMGPIMAFTYATAVRDWRLYRHGLLVLAAGMAVTFVVSTTHPGLVLLIRG